MGELFTAKVPYSALRMEEEAPSDQCLKTRRVNRGCRSVGKAYQVKEPGINKSKARFLSLFYDQ